MIERPQSHCRPGGFKPFIPVLVLRLRRASSEGLGNRNFRPSPELSAAPSGVDAAVGAGDFALAVLISAFLLGWKIRLYIASGLLGDLGGRAGGAACMELVVDWAGEAGVMANVAACVMIGELGRGEGEVEKLKAFEAMEGVTGCDNEPMGQFGTPSPGRSGQVLVLPGLRNRAWCRSSASDSSVSENCGDDEVKSGMSEGERDRWVPSSEELRGLRSPLRWSSKEGGSA